MGCKAWRVLIQNIPNIDGSKSQVMAMVMIHEQVIADHIAESSRYAKVGAARNAMKLLEGLPLMEFRANYSCACRIEEERDGDGEEYDHGTAI